MLKGKFGELDFGDDFNGFDFIGETEDVELDEGEFKIDVLWPGFVHAVIQVVNFFANLKQYLLHIFAIIHVLQLKLVLKLVKYLHLSFETGSSHLDTCLNAHNSN